MGTSSRILDGYTVVDLSTFVTDGFATAFGTLCALFRRERTGEGDRVEIGMHDAVLPLLTKQAAKAFVVSGTTRRVSRRCGRRALFRAAETVGRRPVSTVDTPGCRIYCQT